jgi:hypothetical protein
MKARRALLALGGSVLLVLLGGCGDSSDPSSSAELQAPAPPSATASWFPPTPVATSTSAPTQFVPTPAPPATTTAAAPTATAPGAATRTPTPTLPGFGRTTTTVYAGTIQGMAGQTVSVPIGMNVPSGKQVATMQFNLTVVPKGSAPELSTQITFTSNVGPPILDLDTGLSTRLVGWFINFSPVLTGRVEAGTVNVVIPADAQAGDTYAVQVLYPSGTPDGEIDLPIIGKAGRIEVVVSPPPNATPTPTATLTPTAFPPAAVLRPKATPTPTTTPTPTLTPSPVP